MILFYVFGVVAVVASLLVIAQRNPIYSVLLLIASFGALSGLYVLLDAPFVAVIQIIVYAGAIMVLFLFVVMLLNAPHEETEYRRAHADGAAIRRDAVRRFAGRRARHGAGVGALEGRPRQGGSRGAAVSSVATIGRVLFTDYAFAFEVTSVLILVAMVGPSCSPAGNVMMPTLNDYLVLSAVLFAIGTAGVFVRRNLITILLSIEIMLNAVNLTFVAFGRALGSADGQIIVFFVMTVAAAEAAVGLAIVIALFRHRESLESRCVHELEMVTTPRAAADSPPPVLRLPGERRPRAARQQGRGRRGRVRGDAGVVRRVAGGRLAARRSAARGPCARSARSSSWITSGDFNVGLTLRLDPLVGGHDPRRHRHRVAHSHLLDRLHARGERLGVRPLLLVPEPVCRVHARARPRRELPRDVRRLGGRRPLLVPADRLLVPEDRRPPTPARRRSSSTASATSGSCSGVLLVFVRFGTLDFQEVAPCRLRRCVRRRPSAPCRPSRCCCSSARRASRRRFRSTSGCRTPWRARRRSPR